MRIRHPNARCVEDRKIRPLILRKRDGGKFKISAKALARMLRFIQDHPHKLEAGGVMLGRHILGSRDIIVDTVTIPRAHDRRTRFRFYRDQYAHQRIIDRVWRESGGTCTYLGEWHTHPEEDPLPSALDLREWQRKLREDIFTGEALYFVILGTKHLRVWEGHRGSLECRLASLEEVTKIHARPATSCIYP